MILDMERTDCRMTELFLSVFARSMEAGCLICAVIFARFLLKKAPKNIICILWLFVGVRLFCPVTIESDFSLLPREQIRIQNANTDTSADAKSIAAAGDLDVSADAAVLSGNKNIQSTHKSLERRGALSSFTSAAFLAGNWPKIINAAAYIWLAGIMCLAVYIIYSWCRMKIRVSTAVPAEFEGTTFYQCDSISSPFLFGIVSPKIYVPFSICGQELSYVLKHEAAHRSRRDHWTKPIGYLLLVCYWFHPLVWAAYILFCRDIELACDEKVIREAGSSCKKEYSKALLACSIEQNHKSIAAYPVAFGEIGVKNRVKNILRYKKASIHTVLAAAVVCVVIIACFATKPKNAITQNIEPAGSQMEGLTGNKAEPEGQTGNKAEPESQSGKHTVSESQSEKREGQSGNGTGAQNETMAEEESLELMQSVSKWAEIYCSRDGEEAAELLTDELRENFMDGQSFGWSSPWPWGSGTIGGEQPNYRVVSVDSSMAVILYYAWTSDPHVTVWRQIITYSGKKDDFQIDSMDTAYFDEISSADEFYMAYPDGVIKDTRMDYISSQAYEALSQNVLLSSTNIYKTLSEPGTAAVYLLNLSPQASTETEETDGHMIVTITFEKDQSTAEVEMVQPGGENGIWIPQTDA